MISSPVRSVAESKEDTLFEEHPLCIHLRLQKTLMYPDGPLFWSMGVIIYSLHSILLNWD